MEENGLFINPNVALTPNEILVNKVPTRNAAFDCSEKEFPNRVFSDMAGVVQTLETGLPRLASDHERVRSICAWPWMLSLILKAN